MVSEYFEPPLPLHSLKFHARIEIIEMPFQYGATLLVQ